MQQAIIKAYEGLRKHDGNATAKRLRFAGMLAQYSHKDAVSLLEWLVGEYGLVSGVSKSTVSKMTKVHTAFVQEAGSTADEVAKRLVAIGKAESGVSTLYRALKAASDDVSTAWNLLETGADIRNEGKADEDGDGEGEGTSDDGLSAIMTAVHAARKRGVADADIVAAIESL